MSGQHLAGGGLPLFLRIVADVLVHQGPGRAGVDTGRDFAAGAAVAAEGLMVFEMAADDAVGADHDAGPAADAPVGIGDHRPGGGAADGSGNAGMHAGGIFAVAAEDGDGPVRCYPFDIETVFGGRFLGQGAI